ncbi:hypothetical protein [Arthrobacter sp. MAHUQ-56]
MTDQGFEYFRALPTGAERIAEAEAKTDDAVPVDPDTLDFEPVETPQGWTFPGAERSWRSPEEARYAARTARGQATRAYANYVNALPVPEPTAGQIALADHREALAAFISDGGTEAQAAAFPHLLDTYKTRSGYDAWVQHKRNR